MKQASLVSHSPEETQALGRRLGALARAGDVYLLNGELGAGKTCLTQGIAQGLGVKEQALSPSFVIVREYHGCMALYHIDFYRLNNAAEIASLGIEEYFRAAGVTVIEWAEKGKEVLPGENLALVLDHKSDTERGISIEASGARYEALLGELMATACRSGGGQNPEGTGQA
ncbi:MAG: tRNA (adenosine(37)-N6)-threonylcarbamoyltransferase complex ATPase subunit type 1 TsaE [Chloroflexota bacterium]